jgi:hypothetical protein
MKNDFISIPTAKLLAGVTLFNAVLVGGGTLFSSMTFNSIQANYRDSLVTIRASEKEYQAAVNLLENVSREVDVINARITASIAELSADVKQARDKHILLIESEADQVLEVSVEARSSIGELEQGLSQLAADTQEKIAEDYRGFEAGVVNENTHLQQLRQRSDQAYASAATSVLNSQVKVDALALSSEIEIQQLNESTVNLFQDVREEILQVELQINSTLEQSTNSMDSAMAQFRTKLAQSDADLVAIMAELEDTRIALQVRRDIMLQAPAAGGAAQSGAKKDNSPSNTDTDRPEPLKTN